MILEIALGIVLAYVIISLLPLIVASGIILIALTVVVVLAVAAIYNWKITLLVIGGLLTLALTLGVPYALGLYLTRRYPTLRLAIDGKDPVQSLAQRLVGCTRPAASSIRSRALRISSFAFRKPCPSHPFTSGFWLRSTSWLPAR